MEHVTITGPNESGYYRLTPDKGYMLQLVASPEKRFSEAVTKNPEHFEAVEVTSQANSE